MEIFSPISDLAFFEVLLLDDCACVTVPVSVDESDGAGLRRKRETMCELTDKWWLTEGVRKGGRESKEALSSLTTQ